jgi:pyruvate dehydrogenase E2 component (dihydrolipoamide acetyltransferase)
LQAIRIPAGTDGVAVGTVLAVIADGRGTVAGPAGTIVATPAPNRPAGAMSTRPTGVPEGLATPLAARMALLTGVDVAELSARQGGTRVRRSDVEARLGQVRRSRAQEVQEPQTPVPGSFDDVPLTPMRRVTASRLQQAKREIPHFYLTADCNVTKLVRLRTHLNRESRGPKLTVTDLLLAACALALRDVPLANAIWADDVVRVYRTIDIAFAVNSVRGLITPIVRDCQDKTLAAISNAVRQLTSRAREGRLLPEEYTGGTFTLSNLGMFGVSSATPIVNPPQCCILGVGAIERRPVAIGDGLAVGEVMSLTLAADHRAIDGATGAELLRAIKQRLEDPIALAVL